LKQLVAMRRRLNAQTNVRQPLKLFIADVRLPKTVRPAGRLFHSLGLVTAKFRSPKLLTTQVLESAERSANDDLLQTTADMQSAAPVHLAVMWSYRPALKSTFCLLAYLRIPDHDDDDHRRQVPG